MESGFEKFTGFQWDEGNKNKNLTKHQVENWECEQVFFNEPLLVLDDSKHSLKKKRWAAFGMTDIGRYHKKNFTKRGTLLRVKTARDMNRKERRFYEKNG